MRPSLLIAAFFVFGCAHYAPSSDVSQARDRQGDLLVDVQLRHDLGLTERFVATYTTSRSFGHLVTSERREKHSTLSLERVDRLYETATNQLLTATSMDPSGCHDCTHFSVVVRVGTRVNSFSGPLIETGSGLIVRRLLRQFGGRWR